MDCNLDITCRIDGGIPSPGVLRSLVEASCSGVSVLSLCEKGDAMIMEETGKIFKKEKEMKKGKKINFPLIFQDWPLFSPVYHNDATLTLPLVEIFGNL